MHVAASSGFHRRPRSRAVAWILPELRRRFHRWQANGFPDAMSHVHRAHPVPVTSAASKRYSPHEAVARDARVSPHAAARALLGFRPSRAFLRSSLGSFNPADHSVHRGASTANVGEGYSPPLGETAATSRSRRPRRRRSDPRCERESGRAASRRQPCLPRPWSLRSPACPWSSEVRRTRPATHLREMSCSPGVPCLFGGLASSRAAPTRAPFRLVDRPFRDADGVVVRRSISSASSPRARRSCGSVTTRSPP
jgi:hypothetical protein